MNHIMIAGHLGADPEVRFTSSGKKVTTLRVATHARKSNPNTDDTIWWRVTLWGEQWDKMVSFLKKGSAVLVFGDLHKPELFNDRDGKPQISMNITASEIQFSPFGKTDRPQQDGQQTGQQQQSASAAAPANPVYGASAPNAYTQHATPHHASAHMAPAASLPPVHPAAGNTYDDEIPF